MKKAKKYNVKPLSYIGNHRTPTIILDKEKKLFLIRGRSFPEDATSFYTPVVDWFKEYAQNPNDQTIFTLMFYYYNSSTAKALLDIFKILQDIHNQGKEVIIKWLYHEEDDIIKEHGQDFSELFTFKFEFIPFSDKSIKK